MENRINIHDTFAVRLIRARNARNIGCNELAKKMKVHCSVVYEIEHGQTANPIASTIVRLCKALDVSADYLLGLKEEMK